MATKCAALGLADEQRCNEDATSANGLFCYYHAKVAFGLYRGYKRRNAALDSLDKRPPSFLDESSVLLRNQDFAPVTDEPTLNEIHDWLMKKYQLLDRVIRARKLHHSRFYKFDLDYGHQAYLDKLVNEKHIILRALERLQRRTAEFLNSKAKWFSWVREQQDHEEGTREKEVEKVQREARMFKRHQAILQARFERQRKREAVKMQDAFLKLAHSERQAAESDGFGSDDDEEWDPIEDVLEDERGRFVDTMRKLLWLEVPVADIDSADNPPPTGNTNGANEETGDSNNAGVQAEGGAQKSTAVSRNAKKRAKAKSKAAAAKDAELDPFATPNIEINETKEQMRERLLHGEDFVRLVSVDGEQQRVPKVMGMSEEETEKLLEDITQVKELIFCRLLLSQAALLPAALRANTDLRDLCFKVERPTLQNIRDACADLARNDAAEHTAQEEDDESEEDEEALAETKKDKWQMKLRDGQVPKSWRSKHEVALDDRMSHLRKMKLASLQGAPTFVDFGEIENGKFKSKLVRVKVCGRTIWNYPSDGTMARGGWLQYSVMVKGSRLEDSIVLCRNWKEFWELNVLAFNDYFPIASWATWAKDISRQSLIALGLVPYLKFESANTLTTRQQTGARARGPRTHEVCEYKNVICGYIKRNDAVSRRFVQYLQMESGKLCVLVRDAKTGRVIVKPPDEHLWLTRRKAGIGRAVKNEWVIGKKVGPDLFQMLSDGKDRDWKFGFNDYYDLQIWDLQPGRHFDNLYVKIQEMLIQANRCCNSKDLYCLAMPVLDTLHRDKTTGRVRDARPGEQTMWNHLDNRMIKMTHWDSETGRIDEEENSDAEKAKLLYSDIDANEDLILFPDEASGSQRKAVQSGKDPITVDILEKGPSMKRFIYNLDSDEDSDAFSESDSPRVIAEKRGKKDGLTLRQIRDMELEGLPPCENPDRGDECTCPSCADITAFLEEEQSGNSFLAQHDDEDENDAFINEADIIKYGGDDDTVDELMDFVFDESFEDELRDPHADFMVHMDREKSKVFKKQWHAADLEPGSQERWQEMQSLVVEAKAKIKKSRAVAVQLMKTLMEIEVHTAEHRLVYRDMEDAFAAVSLFLPDDILDAETKAWLATLSQTTQLVDNDAKAKTQLYWRSVLSNSSWPLKFWNGRWEEIGDAAHQDPEYPVWHLKGEPRVWDEVARPTIAHLFKSGIICPGYCPYPSGQAMAVPAHPGDPRRDLFISYCNIRGDWPTMSSTMRDPHAIDLLAMARKHTAKHPNASFALLRIWSAPHFWPLMLGLEKRDWMSFSDVLGRSWTWSFVPKDMPFSEWSMQHTLDLRMERLKKSHLGRSFETKRDMVFVMSESKEQLSSELTPVVFTLQSNPWRFEVDFWKSFIGVDLAFLEKLDKSWVE